MRLLPCIAALALATTTVTTQIAAACGSYEQYRRTPRVMLVSSHHTHAITDGESTSSTRAFVLFGGGTEVTGTHAWDLVAPRTFDSARIREGGTATPETITLVGPSGTKVVTTRPRRVLLAGAFFMHDTVHEAAELPMRGTDDFVIAIRGRAPTATWHGLQYTAHGKTRIDGTNLWIEKSAETDTATVVVRDGTRALGSYAGTALGVVAVDGSRYLITRVNGQARTFDVGL